MFVISNQKIEVCMKPTAKKLESKKKIHVFLSCVCVIKPCISKRESRPQNDKSSKSALKYKRTQYKT